MNTNQIIKQLEESKENAEDFWKWYETLDKEVLKGQKPFLLYKAYLKGMSKAITQAVEKEKKRIGKEFKKIKFELNYQTDKTDLFLKIYDQLKEFESKIN